MGMILHDWNLERKKHLIGPPTTRSPRRRVHRHREPDRRRASRERFGLMMSLNMLIEFGDAFDSPAWTSPVGAGGGLQSVEILPLAGPSAGIAYK